MEPHERKLRRGLQRIFTAQRRETMRRFNRLYRQKSTLSEQPVLFDPSEWVMTFEALYGSTVLPLLEKTILEFAGRDFDLSHPVVRAAVGERTRLFSHLPNETTAKKIQQVLRDGFSAGWSIDEIAANIQYVFIDATRRRAQLIARTEVFGAANFGRYLGARAGGFQFKMWITSRDSRVRESHRIDGQIQKIEDPFVLRDGRKMMYPQDFNERCFMQPLETLPAGVSTGTEPSVAVEDRGFDFSDIPFGTQPPDKYGSLNFNKLPNVHSRVVEWWKNVKNELVALWDTEVKNSPVVKKLRDEYDELTRKTYTATGDEWRRVVEQRKKVLEELEDATHRVKKPVWERQFEFVKEFAERVVGGRKYGRVKLELEPVSSLKLEGLRYKPKGRPTKKSLERMHFYRWLDGKRDEIEQLLSMFIPEGEQHTLRVHVLRKLDRAFQHEGALWLDGRGVDDFGVFMHEFAHWLEEVVDARHQNIVQKFYDVRTRGDVLLPLTGGGQYKPDKWRYPYQGRYYKLGGTEVISMVFTALFDPSTSYDQIVADDDQVVNFFITYLRGWYL